MVAYFIAECGVADCLPIYSGGLGILSGDHLKSSSDLNLPIIGVSLAYQKGYFRQYLTKDGYQMETYPINQFAIMPMELVRDGKGDPVKVLLELKGEEVHIRAWRVNIGRTKLFLLDTNLQENSEWARSITSQLYGGDKEMRMRQEIVLGIGGVRMLKALGLDPAVYHMNEGHSAFAAFERIRELREDKGMRFNEALEFVRFTNVFTTHTPVPAGIDTFPPDLMRAYFASFAKTMGIAFDVLLGFGRQATASVASTRRSAVECGSHYGPAHQKLTCPSLMSQMASISLHGSHRRWLKTTIGTWVHDGLRIRIM
jgi:starch phosphorylase